MSFFPRAKLGIFPTPLQQCRDLGLLLGIDELWVKRDDLVGFSWGGNKVRTIEFLLGDAMSRGSDSVVICGGPTSNFAALMAIACAKHGLATLQVSYGAPMHRAPAALAASLKAGAFVRFTESSDRASMDAVALTCMRELLAQGRRPYFVPRGGATPVGARGFAHAAQEVRRQLQLIGTDAVTIVVPVGSGGTIAGLVAGLTLDFTGDEESQPFEADVIGVCVSRPPNDLKPAIEATVEECSLERRVSRTARCSWRLVDGRGAGFGIYDEREAALADDVMRCTRFLVDTTYNGKAMTWLKDLPNRPLGPLVYWHTGGVLGVIDRLEGRA